MVVALGHGPDGQIIDNGPNFPSGDLHIQGTEWVYEIPNPFPFFGTTYLLHAPADRRAEDPYSFRFRSPRSDQEQASFIQDLLSGRVQGRDGRTYTLGDLPPPVRLAFAQTSAEPNLLAELAKLACELEFSQEDTSPVGLRHTFDKQGRLRPAIQDPELFEVVVNNHALPEAYKRAMILVPGIQGTNPVVGEYISAQETHVWEYLRANSYIPWGHYASNMAHDCVRYRVGDLRPEDIAGLRHLYYQRTYTQMALTLGLKLPRGRHCLSDSEIEDLRIAVTEGVLDRLTRGKSLPFTATIWGWNFGFDFSASGYRLHASHQQIHQQFALVPPTVEAAGNDSAGAEHMPTYVVGDQVTHFVTEYQRVYGTAFFHAYLSAIRSNRRLDRRGDRPSSLILSEEDNVLIQVPKAQRSQGEIQILATGAVGNILDADGRTRRALDRAIRKVVQTMDRLGVQMITCYEVSKRFDNPDTDQRLFYCFLPRHPDSPGAFSEWQQRWVTGHYPEDYAEACRRTMGALV